MMARLAIGLLLCSLALPLPASAIQVLTGGAVDATRYTPPCTTFGFSVEAISTLPTGHNNARMVRIDRSGNTQTGYVLTSNATGYTIYTFDFKTMAALGSSTVTPVGYRDASRLQGDVSTVDGKLYVFYEVSTADPFCPVNRCVVMARWAGNSLESAVTDTFAGAVDNIDDARESGAQFLVVLSSVTTATRVFRTYDRNTLARITTGTNTGISSFGHIARAGDGVIYGTLTTNTGNPNIWVFGLESATAFGSGFNFYTAGNGVGAIYPRAVGTGVFEPPVLMDSANEVTPQRSYISPAPITLAGPLGFPLTSANLAAAFQGSFYDSVNRKIFSLRYDNAVGASIALRSDVFPITSDERFGCASCINSGGSTTGTQIVDYNQAYARMYVGSNETPARVSKIKVCAVGGPP